MSSVWLKRKWVLGLVLPVILVIILLFTSAGVRLVCFGIELASGGVLQVGAVSGRLFCGFSASDIRIGKERDGGRLKQLELLWNPAALLQGKLHIEKIVADDFYLRKKEDKKRDAGKEQRSDRGSAKQGQITSRLFIVPLEIIIDYGHVSNFFYDRGVDNDGSAYTSFDFNSIDIAGVVSKHGMVLRKLQLDGPDIAANLRGGYHRASEAEQSPQLTLDGTVRFAGFGFHSMSGKLSVTGTFKEVAVSASLDQPGELVVLGTLHNFLEENTSWQAQLRANDFDLSSWIKHCPQIVVKKGTAEMRGDFSHYEGHALFYGSWERLESFALEGNLYGDGEQIDFSSLSLRQGGAVVEVNGGWLSWRDVFDTKGAFTLKNVNPALFFPGLDGRLDGHLYMESGVDGHDYKGVFKDISLEGRLHNRPLSARGSLFLCNTTLQTDGLYLQGGIAKKWATSVKSSESSPENSGKGVVAIESASIDWGEEGGWEGSISLHSFDPAAIFSEYPGRVDAEVESKGRFPTSSTPLFASLQIKKLAGELRGQKLYGAGAVSFANNLLQSKGLSLQFGKTGLQLSKGTLAFGQPLLSERENSFSLRLDAHSPAIEELVPGSKGAFSLTAQFPDSSSVSTDSVGSVQFRGEELAWRNLLFQQLTLDFGGSIKEHCLTVAGDGNIGGKSFAVHLVARGGFSSDFTGGVAAFRQWQGQIMQGELDLQKYGRWLQQGVSSVSVGTEMVAIDNFALQGAAASLSSSLSLKKDGDDWDWQTGARIEAMELRQWQKILDLPVDLTGIFSADFTASGKGRLPVTAEFSAKLPATTITREDLFVHGEAIELVDGRVVGQLQNGLLTITGGFKENGSGNLQCEVQIGKKGKPLSGDLPLAGRLKSNGLDVSLLGNFLSYSQPVGRLYADLSLGGILAQPELSGKLSLAGGIGILSQGISLQEPSITLWVNHQETRFQGRAFSGKGFVNIDGFLHYDDGGVVADCRLHGKNFLAVDLPEYTFVVDPDIHFHGDLCKGHLDGNIEVVSGMISPSYLPDTISESDDVVLVRTAASSDSSWHLGMNMEVDFGENVSIDGYGLTGKVRGELQLVMTEEQLLAATGALKLDEGEFTMYGRSLDITRGNIIFSGGPISNPGIDVRAEKTMSSEQTLEDGYTVGVDIAGLTQNLRYDLFSSPPMSETEILSYMVLGHSLAGSDAGEGSILAAAAEHLGLGGSAVLLGGLGKLLSFDDLHLEGSVEKEDVSLVVGKRLTKDIYVGYDVNMYSQLGEFWIRYNLGKGFSVQTFSSSQSTGGDLQFSFDR